MRACAYGPAGADGSGPAVLQIIGLRPGAQPMRWLVRELLPPGVPAARIKFVGGGPLPGCGRPLPDLRELAIEGCSPGSEGGWDAFFVQLLPAAPQLTQLVFAPAAAVGSGSLPAQLVAATASGSGSSSGSGQLPAALVASPGQLWRLELRGTQLAGLPTGPYLKGELGCIQSVR